MTPPSVSSLSVLVLVLILVLPMTFNNTEEDDDDNDFGTDLDIDDDDDGAGVGGSRNVCMAKSGNRVTSSSNTFEATRLFFRLTKRSRVCRRPEERACVHVISVSVSASALVSMTGASVGVMLLAALTRHSSTLRATEKDGKVGGAKMSTRTSSERVC